MFFFRFHNDQVNDQDSVEGADRRMLEGQPDIQQEQLLPPSATHCGGSRQLLHHRSEAFLVQEGALAQVVPPHSHETV